MTPRAGAARRVGVRAAAIVAVCLALAAGPAAAQTNPDPGVTDAGTGTGAATEEPATTTSSTAPASTTTSTTLAPARCDAVPPVAAVFVGTVIAIGPDSIKYHVDKVRDGNAATEEQVLYVRDARFVKDGQRYLVTASADAETKLLVSKVRPKRGEDPRCAAKDPIYTRNLDGTAIDSGIFAGVKGHRRDVLLAFLKPTGIVVGVLAALVTAKYLLIFGWRGLRLVVRHAVGRAGRRRASGASAP